MTSETPPSAPSAPEPVPAPPSLAGPAPRPGVPQAIVKRQAHYSLWLVWLVPLIAVAIGLWLGVKSVLDHGPTIVIHFRSAEGLEAGKTKIKYKDVDIGIVKRISLTRDHKEVEVVAEMNKTEGVDDLLVDDSRFWIVRPHVGAGGITGLGTLLSGAYVGMDIGHSPTPQHTFRGLEVPPIVTADLPGRKFVLKGQNLGSLDIGSEVYYRHVPVGQVVAYDLDAKGRQISFTIFVNAPYNRFVNANTRFWHASGIDVSLSADGVKVATESIASLIAGGIAFQDLHDNLANLAPEASDNAEFTLFADRTSALKEPDLYGFDYVLLYQSSVRGLSVGAPVDFRGLSIGEVTSIGVSNAVGVDNPAPQIAVTIRVYPNRLPILGGATPSERAPLAQRAALDPMVAKGFRAQLRTGNLLTGQLYVAMDFIARTAPAKIDWDQTPPRLPTVPGTFDSLQDSLVSLADKLDRLPYDKIAGDLHQTLQSLNQTVQHTDHLVQQISTDVAPEARGTLQDVRKTLASVSQTLDSLSATVGPQAPLTAQAGNALTEVARAAGSLRALADYLERHPESLVRGKPEDPKR